MENHIAKTTHLYDYESSHDMKSDQTLRDQQTNKLLDHSNEWHTTCLYRDTTQIRFTAAGSQRAEIRSVYVKRFGSLVVLVLVMFATSTYMRGQAISVNGGSIEGTITDPTGAAIPGAMVVITSPDTGYRHELLTDHAGYYSLGPLNPGNYSVIISAPGFSNLKVNTVVKTGTSTSGNEKLAVGGSGTTVEVDAGAIQVNTDQIGVASVISKEQINSLPINGRNILDIAQLEPGVILQEGESFDPTKAGYSALSVGGVGGRTTRILFDGQDITDETVGTTLFNVPSSAVGDFQLNRADQDVSGEVTSTGQVLMSSPAGTNTFHGQLFYNFDDNKVGFANIAGISAPFQRNQFGGTIGGPIIKDKLFFFGDYERLKQDEQDAAQASQTFSDPTQLAGEASLPGGPALTTPILLKYPFVPAPFRDNFGLARLDYNAPFGIHLFARAVYSVNTDTASFGSLYSLYKNRNYTPALIGGADFTTGRFTHSIRGGYEKFHNLLRDATAGFGNSIYDPNPAYALQGDTGLYAGPNYLAPQDTFQSDKQLRYDGTYSKGAHTFKFGGELNRIDGGGGADFFGTASYVEYGPSSGLANCGNVANAAPCLGDPINGYSQELVLTGNGNELFSEKPGFNLPGGGVFSWRIAAYGADTWKIKSWLTATAGLRWDVDTDRANQDLPTPLCSSLSTDVQFAGCTGNTALFDQYGPGLGLGQKVHQPYGNFGPQVGFVISPGAHKYSIRGGAGIYYENDIFNNTGNARPSVIPLSAKAVPYNQYGAPCADYFPGATTDPSAPGLSAACIGGSLGQLSGPLSATRTSYQAQTKGVLLPNPGYIGTDTGGDLNANGVYAGPYKTPYSIQYNIGFQREIMKGLIVTTDFLHNSTLKVPLTIDTNRQGAARTLNTAAATAAISATTSGAGCAGGATSTAINCAIAAGADIVSFAGNGLDSGNDSQFFAGTPANQTGAAFGGNNRNVGQGRFILPTGKSGYDAFQVVAQEQRAHPVPGIKTANVQISYSLSRIVTETKSVSTEDQFFAGAGPWDQDDPRSGLGRSTLDHTQQISFGASFVTKYNIHMGVVGHFFSAPPNSLTINAAEYGGIGEIFRSDVTGDGTVGDRLAGTQTGDYMHAVKGKDLNNLIANWNSTQAGSPTPAGQALINSGLFTLTQLQQINAVKPLLSQAPGNPLRDSATRVLDAVFSYPITLARYRKGLSVEPGVSFFNLFNMSNYGSASGNILTQDEAVTAQDPTGRVNYIPGYLAGPATQAVLNSQFRVARGSGTFDQGAARSTEFQLKLNF